MPVTRVTALATQIISRNGMAASTEMVEHAMPRECALPNYSQLDATLGFPNLLVPSCLTAAIRLCAWRCRARVRVAWRASLTRV